MTGEVETMDIRCPRCSTSLSSQPCHQIGCDEGYIDVYDEDSLWYEPGDAEACSECKGNGTIIWCAGCGWCMNEQSYFGYSADMDLSDITKEAIL